MMSAVPELSLEEVAHEFAEWRRHRTTLQTPDALRRKALALLSSYRVSDVLNALNLSHKSLKRWQQTLLPPPAPSSPATTANVAFMPLTMPSLENAPSPQPAQANLTLTLHRRDGTRVSIEGELRLEQWQRVIGLLCEAAE